MKVTLAQLEALLAVADAGSFTEAARALGLTQSAVSRAVAAVERQLRAPVFQRSAGGARLTAIGRDAVPHARAALEHVRAFEMLAASTPAPQLRVGAVTSAAVRLLPEVRTRWRREHPMSGLLIVHGDDDELHSWVGDGTIDVAISTTTLTPATTGTSFVDEFMSVLPAHHPLARHDRIALEDLVNAGVADPGGTCGPQLEAQFAAHGVAWEPAHLVRDVQTVLAMAAAGITAGVVPALAVPLTPPPGIRLLPLEPPLHRHLHITHNRDHPLAHAFAELACTIGGQIGGHAP